jgi:predicted nucleotide-binding protein
MGKKLPPPAKATKPPKRSYIKQSDMPRLPLSETIRLAQSLFDEFAGKSAQPHQLAMSVDVSPTSSNWDSLTGAAIAYGLTEGGSRAERITLTQLGKRVVAPTEEGDDARARVEAVLQPRIIREFFERYNRAKFPSDKIARNVLAEMGVQSGRIDELLEVIKRNGEFAGIIHQTKTGPFVAVDDPVVDTADEALTVDSMSDEETSSPPSAKPLSPGPIAKPDATGQRVFITHGKNAKIVNQLKDLLTFGKFVPVVAEEHETTSKPVPDKVLDDMRGCFAGIIHVENEEELLDAKGEKHLKLNENVLIEIGAALALFRRNVILLVHKGVTLPSNLQGLYKCYYEGQALDYDATMKLLKAFNDFGQARSGTNERLEWSWPSLSAARSSDRPRLR